MKIGRGLINLIMASCTALVSSLGYAQQCADVSNLSPRLDLMAHVSEYLPADSERVSSWHDLPPNAFRPLPENSATFNYTNLGQDHWLRLCLSNSTAEVGRVVLAFDPFIIQELDFYPEDSNQPSFQTGLAREFSSRDIDTPFYAFSAAVEPGETEYFYLRINSRTNVTMSGRLYDADDYQADLRYQAGFYGILAGIFLGLILYNLMLYITVRQKSALLYVCFASVIFLTLNFFDGRVFQYVLSDYPRLNYQLMFLVYYLVSLTGGLFSRTYLKLENHPRLKKISLAIIGIFTVMSVPAYMISIPLYLQVAGMFAITTIVFYVCIAGVALLAKGSMEARYYLLAQSPFLFVALDRTFVNLGLAESYILTYDPLVGLAASMVLLAYGVGRTLHADKDNAQQQALQLQTSYNAKLEQEIAAATSEILVKNEILARRAQQLVDMEQARSAFFANISHEFRTPLTLIQGPLDSLKDSLTQHGKNTVKAVLRQTQQLQNLIDQLLTLSKFDSDSLELQAQKQDAVKLIRYLTSQFTSYAEQKGISLNFHSPFEELDAYLDTEKLQIVINNLLSNAIKFTDKGGKIDVELGVFGLPADEADNFDPDNLSKDAYLQIAVKDTGCGISEQNLPLIFDRYFQARHPNKIQQGTGIGLSLSKDLVALHVGQIKATSIEGVGSRFIVQLPLGSAHLKAGEIITTDLQQALSEKVSEELNSDEPAAQPLPAAVVEPATAEGERVSVLVVDDNMDMREYLGALLQPFYHVVMAEDGVHAEEVLASEAVSLIITDLMMPRRDGLALIERVRQDARFAHTPIIMLTAKAGQADKLTGLEACADDYLAKPFDAKELLTRISNLLKKQEQLRVFYGQSQGAGNSATSQPEHELISRMRRIVEARLHEESFGVEELAKDLFISSPTLRRRLSEISSFSPSDFIRQCRLEKARQLAATGQYRTLSSLANAVGFNQTSYFSRLYQKAFNHPPLAAIGAEMGDASLTADTLEDPAQIDQ